MPKFMTRFEPEAYALLRMVSGFMFCFHGVQKILGLFGGMVQPLGSQMWVGGIIELVGGFCVMIGLRTRLAAFITSGMMAVAYFQFHWKFQMGEQFLPGVNKGEMAVLYCFVFLLIAARGAGQWAVDKQG